MTPPAHVSTAPTVIEGTWHTNSKDLHTGAVFHDVTTPKEEVTVAPIEEQSEWESRKLWFGVSKGIREGDFETAATFKGKIEVCSFRSRMVLLDSDYYTLKTQI